MIICAEEFAVPRKFLLLSVTALLALVSLPASAASAKSSGGSFLGCYGIKKKGNYNHVRAGVHGDISGHTVAAQATLAVTATCQRLNSLPVVEMHIYTAVLKTATGTVLAHTGGVSTRHKAEITRHTRHVGVKCGTALRVEEKIGYTYYDHSVVRPFVVHGSPFFAC
jgi:uncharacterized membrane protein